MQPPILTKRPDGLYCVRWKDTKGKRRQKTFGRERGLARLRYQRWCSEWLRDPSIANPALAQATLRLTWTRFQDYAERSVQQMMEIAKEAG